ncbi:MAG TPA: FtsQ-type POTRA domain-containing protein [Terriglobales bacterium]|nr:FtsQ-type POTRA domain-containing protein [Terriglobales bacterium]
MKSKPEAEPLEPPLDDLVEAGEETAEDPGYRRRATPVRVRQKRGGAVAGQWKRLRKPILLSGLGLVVLLALYTLLFRSTWFVLAGSDQISISGAVETDPARVLAVFASDYGRNVFFIPLDARRSSLDAIPWVQTAAVMRVWPAHIVVRLRERAPVAQVRVGDHLQLVDAAGSLLDPPAAGAAPQHFDFPVITGLADSATDRRPQMRQYQAFMNSVDGHTADISEIDLSDPANLKARVSLPGHPSQTALLQLGDHNFARRYGLFLSQAPTWLDKYPTLAGVDLRYDGEAIVDPGVVPAAKPATKPGTKH